MNEILNFIDHNGFVSVYLMIDVFAVGLTASLLLLDKLSK